MDITKTSGVGNPHIFSTSVSGFRLAQNTPEEDQLDLDQTYLWNLQRFRDKWRAIEGHFEELLHDVISDYSQDPIEDYNTVQGHFQAARDHLEDLIGGE